MNRIYQFTLDGKYVANYSDIKLLSKEGFRTHDIKRVIEGERKTAGGFQWRLVEDLSKKN